ncbi:MAG: SDR family oxidoreductase [Anaerolineales bacterium]|nr:SDR family oxidoreductase [Anaerolineales bacterium]
MRGKVCMVTGATSGIGQVTAAALAMQGAHVIVVGRNRAKAQQVVGEIRRQSGNDAVWYLLADFSDLQQVRELAAAFSAQYSQLDVLVNNAGTYFNTRHPAPGGVEMTFHVNHLAHFLLTNLLLETLTASAPARIVNVTSRAHEYDNMDFDDLGFERSYFGMKAYARSKLANLLFTYELARRLAGSGVTVNAVHPGGVATDIWRTNFPVLGPAIKWVMSLFALTPEEGADTLIYLASSPDVEGVTGKYFVEREAIASSPLSYDEQVAARLWEVSEQLTAV